MSEPLKYREVAPKLTDHVCLDFVKHGCRHPSIESRTKIILRGDSILVHLEQRDLLDQFGRCASQFHSRPEVPLIAQLSTVLDMPHSYLSARGIHIKSALN